jgi:hypothetical protein
MRDEDEDELLKSFVDFFVKSGVQPTNISALYRSKENEKINEYIKQFQLNNFVDENTKVVFIKYKVPKILYNLNFKPLMILNTLDYNAHYSIQKLVTNHPFALTCH